MLRKLRTRLKDLAIGRLDAAIASLTLWRARLSGADLGTVAAAAGPKDEMISRIRLLVNLRWGVHALVPLVLFLPATQASLQVHELIPNNKSFEVLAHLTRNPSYLAATITLNAVLYYLIGLTSGLLNTTIQNQAASLARRANEATMLHEVSSSLQ